MTSTADRRARPFLIALVLLAVLAWMYGYAHIPSQYDRGLTLDPRASLDAESSTTLPIGAVLLFSALVFVSEALAIIPAAVGLAMGPVLGTVSVSSALDMASLFIFYPWVTMTSSAIGTLAANLKNRKPARVVVFNTAQAVLVNWAAGVTFESLRTSWIRFSVILDAPAVIVAISARVVAVVLLDMAYLYIVEGIPLRAIWSQYTRGGPLAENFFIAPIGFLAAVVWYLRPWTVVLIIIPTVANYVALRRHLDVTRWNRTLEETVARRTSDLEQAMDRLRRLHEASLALAQELDLQRTMQVVANQAASLAGAAGALVDARADAPLLWRRSEAAEPTDAGRLRSFVRRYMPEGRRTAGLEDLPEQARAEAGTLGIGDLLAVRLGVAEADQGLLLAWTPEPGGFSSPTRLADLEAFATQAGIALENARLYDQTREMAVMAERNRLARELHDSISQSLFSIVLTAEAASRLTGGNSPSGRAMSRVQEIARETLAEMRALIFELRPATLRERGLVYALSNHVELFRRRQAQMDVQFEVLGERRFNADAELALYRIAQEALTNVAKHAAATRVDVLLDLGHEGRVRLEVADNGRGFVAGEPTGRQTLGLTSMRERAENLGGWVTVTSLPGKGTQVTAELPLTPMPHDGGEEALAESAAADRTTG